MSLCTPLLANKKQVGAIIETTCGQGGAFTAASIKFRPSSLTVDTEMTPIEDNTLSASLSKRKIAMGEKKATLKAAGYLVGSGVAGTKPESDVFLRACGMTSKVVQSIAIGAVTGGPFVPGEIVSQAVSLATGIVVKPAYTGDAKLYVVVVTGTFNGTGLITGGTSAATATASAIPAAAGFAYHPISTGFETAAFKVEEDGKIKNILGAAGTATISCDSASNPKIEFTMMGVMGDYVDGAMTTNVTYYDSTYPIFTSARCVMDRGLLTEFTPVVRSVSVDMQGESVVRKDANQSTGLIAGRVTARTPQIMLTAEEMLNADFDVFDAMANSDSVTIGFNFESPDNSVTVFGTNGQITANPSGEADGIMTGDITFRMNGIVGDDEIWIVFTV